MSLRMRVALLVGVVVAAAMATGSVGAYSVARGEQYDTIDQFLRDRAAGVDRFADTGSSPEELFDEATAARLRANRPAPFVADDALAVLLDASGDVVFSSNPSIDVTSLPDAELDRIDTIALDGERYRRLAVATGDGGMFQIARSLAEADATLGQIRVRLVALGIAVTALAILLGWWAARRMSRPIEQLSAAAVSIARDGGLPAVAGGADELDVRASGEVGRLARSLSTMLAALRRSHVEQQQLVVDAGHELRTPLTTMRTNIELLERGRLTPEDRDVALRVVRAELDELANLTEELVELATDSQRADPPRGGDLLAVASAAADRARQRHRRVVEVRGSTVPIVGQLAMLDRAITNILDNAVKFSPAGAPIEVNVTPGRVEVRDHGPGIDPDDLPHVFERFYRAPASRSLPGSGLGLAIVAKIAEAHGGEAYARNAEHGTGAVVGFTIVTGDLGDGEPRMNEALHAI